MKNRLNLILKIITAKDDGRASVSEILLDINKNLKKKVAKVTINRDLEKLIKERMIERVGEGRTTSYKIALGQSFFKEIDISEYFKIEPDRREIMDSFNFKAFDIIKKIDLFQKEELEKLIKLNTIYQNNLKKISSTILKKEFERLTIELSWKSSQIEGNTYDLLETEFLIKENRESKGHTKKEAIMILNHKEALDYIRKNSKSFKEITVSLIKDVHNILIKDLGISEGVRRNKIGITGTKYRPLDNKKEIEKGLMDMCEVINSKKDVFSKVLLANTLIAYLQPFNDGNKRTSRFIGNAILLANNYCPLSFRSIDDLEYKKAMILFYELNSIRRFKELFIEQFNFAVNNYFKA